MIRLKFTIMYINDSICNFAKLEKLKTNRKFICRVHKMWVQKHSMSSKSDNHWLQGHSVEC